MTRDDEDAVWNRACEPGRFPSPGDDALDRAFRAHFCQHPEAYAPVV